MLGKVISRSLDPQSFLFKPGFWQPAIITFTLSLIPYLLTLSPTITWKNGGVDSGELAVASYYLGVAHPTGYPLYVLLGKLFTTLPWGDVAYRLNLMSAILAASAAALLSAAIWILLVKGFSASRGLGSLAATFSGLLFAYSPAFWSQAIIAEVYALHILFLSAVIFLLFSLRYYTPRPRLVHFLTLGFVSGLAFSHHSTAVLAFPSVALYIIASNLRGYVLTTKWLLSGMAAFLCGLSPYLLILIRSNKAPEANWGAVDSLPSLFQHITGAVYRPLLLSPVELDAFQRVASAARLLLEQYGWLGFVAAVIGLWYMALLDRRLLVFWVITFFSALVFAVSYSARDSEVHLLPIYLLVAISIGTGIAFVVTAIENWLFVPTIRRSRNRRGRGNTDKSNILDRRLTGFRSLYFPSVVLLCVLWLGWSVRTTAIKVDLSEDREAYNYAVATLDALPSGAVILTNDDNHTFSLWYLQYVINYRRDVLVVDNRLLNWGWYHKNLKSLYPEVRLEGISGTASERVQKFVQNNIDRFPVFSAYKPTLLKTEDIGPPFKVGQ